MSNSTRGSKDGSTDLRLDKRVPTEEDRELAEARGELPLDTDNCALCGRDGDATYLQLWTPVSGGPGVYVAETIVSLCKDCKKNGRTGLLKRLTYQRYDAATGDGTDTGT